jgi:hypothetical protein
MAPLGPRGDRRRPWQLEQALRAIPAVVG